MVARLVDFTPQPLIYITTKYTRQDTHLPCDNESVWWWNHELKAECMITWPLPIEGRFALGPHGGLSWGVFIGHGAALRVSVEQQKRLEMTSDTLWCDVLPLWAYLNNVTQHPPKTESVNTNNVFILQTGITGYVSTVRNYSQTGCEPKIQTFMYIFKQ